MSAIRCICFRDFDRIWHRVDETGFNKSGYITRRNTVIYPWLSRGLTEAPLSRIQKYPHRSLLRNVDIPEQIDNVERFFTENVSNIVLFNSGMHAIATQKDVSFFDKPVRLPILDEIAPQEFERRWERLQQIVSRADLIAMFDTKSLISRLTARFDHGTWSHIGFCTGEGTILEESTTGVVESSIEEYRNPRYRLGIYRFIDLDEETAVNIVKLARSQLNARYNFLGFARLAMIKVLGIRLSTVDPKNLSPNDLACSERVRLIYVV